MNGKVRFVDICRFAFFLASVVCFKAFFYCQEDYLSSKVKVNTDDITFESLFFNLNTDECQKTTLLEKIKYLYAWYQLRTINIHCERKRPLKKSRLDGFIIMSGCSSIDYFCVDNEFYKSTDTDGWRCSSVLPHSYFSCCCVGNC